VLAIGHIAEYSARVNVDLDSPAAAAGPNTLRHLVARCGGGNCPTIYETGRGTVVVQGRVLEPDAAGVSAPPGEQLVEVPIELLTDYLTLRP
jgi:hypothetical protein